MEGKTQQYMIDAPPTQQKKAIQTQHLPISTKQRETAKTGSLFFQDRWLSGNIRPAWHPKKGTQWVTHQTKAARESPLFPATLSSPAPPKDAGQWAELAEIDTDSLVWPASLILRYHFAVQQHWVGKGNQQSPQRGPSYSKYPFGAPPFTWLPPSLKRD